MSTRPTKNAMATLIESGVSGIMSTNHVLARLWRIILHQYTPAGRTFQRRLDDYVQHMNDKAERHGASPDHKGNRNMKGNYIRCLSKDTLTWKNLMIGLAIIGFSKVRFEMHLTRNGETNIIGIDVTPEDIPSLLGDDEDEDE